MRRRACSNLNLPKPKWAEGFARARAMAGGSTEKRKAEEADAAPEEGARRSKRRRWDSADDANADAGAAAEASKDAPATDEPAAEKPAPSVAEKLAKAKAAAAKARPISSSVLPNPLVAERNVLFLLYRKSSIICV